MEKKTKNTLIKAYAGAGKTTKLLEIIENEIEDGKKIEICCFNKAIKQELENKIKKNKLQKNKKIKIGTMHSIALRICKLKLDVEIVPFYSYKEIPNINKYDKKQHYNIKYSLESILDDFIKTDLTEEEFVQNDNSSEVGIYEKNLKDIFLNFIKARKKDGKLTHSLYVKFAQLYCKEDKTLIDNTVDYLIVDEYQDATQAIAGILEQYFSKSNKVYAGDEHQNIFFFTGSNKGGLSIDGFDIKYLKNTWRFSQNICNLAIGLKTIPEDFGSNTDNDVTEINYIDITNNSIAETLTREQQGTYISITNFRIMEIAYLLFNKGIDFTPKVDNVNWKKIIQNKLIENKTVEEYRKNKKKLNAIGAENPVMRFLFKKIDETIQMGEYNNSHSINSILDDLEDFFKYIEKKSLSKKTEDIILTNIFKEKGKEYNTVVIDREFISSEVGEDRIEKVLNNISKKTTGDEIDAQTVKNVLYTAITRVRKKLYVPIEMRNTSKYC